jgi:hypothetical protein
LSLAEIKEMKDTMNLGLKNKYNLEEITYQRLMAATQKAESLPGIDLPNRESAQRSEKRAIKTEVKKIITETGLSGRDRKGVMKLFKNEMKINARIKRLQLMQTLFKHWHVAHLPFALVMLVIMVIHVAITITFGYRWIF